MGLRWESSLTCFINMRYEARGAHTATHHHVKTLAVTTSSRPNPKTLAVHEILFLTVNGGCSAVSLSWGKTKTGKQKHYNAELLWTVPWYRFQAICQCCTSCMIIWRPPCARLCYQIHVLFIYSRQCRWVFATAHEIVAHSCNVLSLYVRTLWRHC
jgi:hypothetical protein